MFIEELELTNFRSYEHLKLHFNPGITVFIGRNGQGKTNIVEAVIYATNLESHRVSSDHPLIRKDSNSAIINLNYQKQNRKNNLLLELNSEGANKAFINNNQTKRKNEIIGNVNSVYFSPEDLDIVRGDPSDRRKFIDQVIIQTFPKFSGIFTDYDRALKQRNSGLKSQAPKLVLEPFYNQIIELGSKIITARVNMLENLTPFLKNNYLNIANEDSAVISYQSAAGEFTKNETQNLEILKKYAADKFQQELERKITLIGPHRDNLFLGLRGFPVSGFASHGETWSYTLSLKLAVLDYLKSIDLEPILILDDVFAELDNFRREHLVQLAISTTQTFVTTAVEADLPTNLNFDKYYIYENAAHREVQNNHG
jgi:DNA replication and repair protein RecF